MFMQLVTQYLIHGHFLLAWSVKLEIILNGIMKINSTFWISLVCVSFVFFPEITVLSVGMALIGISYPYLITRNSLIRIIATVFFGLLHGFGFASNLSYFDSQSLVSSIILFNLGIEAAQILGSGIVPLISGYPGAEKTMTTPSPSPLQTGLSTGATLAGIYRLIRGSA